MPKNILVVGACVPAFDMSHGSYRTDVMIDLLRRRYRVHFLALEKHAGRRYEQAMAAKGVNLFGGGTGTRPATFQALIERLAIDTVLFVGHRTAFPLLFCVPRGVATVIDSQDIDFLRLERQARVTGEAGLRAYARIVKQRETLMYRMADLVIAINGKEQDVLRSVCPAAHVEVFPTPLSVIPPYRDEKDRNHLVFFGYFYNEANVDAIRYLSESILPRIRKQHEDIRCHIAGFGARDALWECREREDIRIQGRVRDIHSFLRRFRVFVAPLRYGAGSKKKILDAMASGVPVVTTSIGAEGLKMRNGLHLLVADSPGIFAEKVIRLYRDDRLWRRISANAYRMVQRNYALGPAARNIPKLFD